MEDLFTQYDKLPQELQAILDKYGEIETYKEREAMLKECNAIGYTFDYYLDATPYNLRKIITGYVATVQFSDEPEPISGYIFKIGSFDEDNATEEERIADQNVFYYLQNEKEIEELKEKGNQDFIVLSYEPLYD